MKTTHDSGKATNIGYPETELRAKEFPKTKTGLNTLILISVPYSH